MTSFYLPLRSADVVNIKGSSTMTLEELLDMKLGEVLEMVASVAELEVVEDEEEVEEEKPKKKKSKKKAKEVEEDEDDDDDEDVDVSEDDNEEDDDEEEDEDDSDDEEEEEEKPKKKKSKKSVTRKDMSNALRAFAKLEGAPAMKKLLIKIAKTEDIRQVKEKYFQRLIDATAED